MAVAVAAATAAADADIDGTNYRFTGCIVKRNKPPAGGLFISTFIVCMNDLKLENRSLCEKMVGLSYL